ADAKDGCTQVSDDYTRRSRSLARSASTAGEDADPPGCQRDRRTAGAAARQTLLRAPSVIRQHAQITATRHAKRAVRLWQAPSPVWSPLPGGQLSCWRQSRSSIRPSAIDKGTTSGLRDKQRSPLI